VKVTSFIHNMVRIQK